MVSGFIEQPGVALWARNEDQDGYDMRLRSKEYSNDDYHYNLKVIYKREFIVNYYLKDHLGNIRVTIDEGGKVVSADDYAMGIPVGLSFWLANAGQIF